MSGNESNDPFLASILRFLSADKSFAPGERENFSTELEARISGVDSFRTLLRFYDDHREFLPDGYWELDWEKQERVSSNGFSNLTDDDLIDLVRNPHALLATKSRIFEVASEYWRKLIRKANPEFQESLDRLPTPSEFVQRIKDDDSNQSRSIFPSVASPWQDQVAAVLLGPTTRVSEEEFSLWEIPLPLSDAWPLDPQSPIPLDVSGEVLGLRIVQPKKEEWLAIGFAQPLSIENATKLFATIESTNGKSISGTIASIDGKPCIRFEQNPTDLLHGALSVEYEDDDFGLRIEVNLDPRWREIDDHVMSDRGEITGQLRKLAEASGSRHVTHPLEPYHDELRSTIRKHLDWSKVKSEPQYRDTRVLAKAVVEALEKGKLEIPFPLTLVAVALVKNGLDEIFDEDDS